MDSINQGEKESLVSLLVSVGFDIRCVNVRFSA